MVRRSTSLHGMVFLIPYKLVVHDWGKSYSVTIQMKAIEQLFPVVLFIIL